MNSEAKNELTLAEIKIRKKKLEESITNMLFQFEDEVGSEIKACGIETIHSSGGRLGMEFKIEISI